MADLKARGVQKAVIATLSGLGDTEIPAALSKVAKILHDAGFCVEPESEPAPVERAHRGGRDRMERGGHDRSE